MDAIKEFTRVERMLIQAYGIQSYDNSRADYLQGYADAIFDIGERTSRVCTAYVDLCDKIKGLRSPEPITLTH